MRIVSLQPSATEIGYALGPDDQLVGVTFEGDEPASPRLEKAVVDHRRPGPRPPRRRGRQARVVRAALPELPIWGIDGDGLIVRPGPRVVAVVEALASIMHPDRFGPLSDAVLRM